MIPDNQFAFPEESSSSIKKRKQLIGLSAYLSYTAVACFVFLVTAKIYFLINPSSSSRQLASINKKAKKLFSIPSFFIHFKDKAGTSLARMEVSFELDKKESLAEIKKKEHKIQNHLLILLSGRELENFLIHQTHFEEEATQQINAFLSRDSIQRIYLKTKLFNQGGDI